MRVDDPHALFTPAEVAELFRVNPKTVTRWAERGLLPHVRTLGGHRRFPVDAIRALLTVEENSSDGDGPRDL